MPDTPDHPDERREEAQPLSERLLDLFVFLPTGLAVTVAEELPRLAERGREKLGVHVNSARAVGQFAVTAGGHELKRRSAGVGRPSPGRAASSGGGAPTTPPAAPRRLRTIPYPEDRTPDTGPVAAPGPAETPPRPAATPPPAAAPVRPPADAHVPDVGTLAIPGFDTLSASQVVQRLDGLSRSELVAVRAYETSTRGRRTILSRVDQLLDERS